MLILEVNINYYCIRMFFYGEDTQDMLRKQRLSNYIQEIIISDKGERKVMPSAKLAQVVTMNSISDSAYDYPCVFVGEKYKKGSYIRLIKWELNSKTCEFFIYEAQYLGGAGCEVIHGKKWDTQKIKHMMSSKILSKHFLIILSPTDGIQETKIPQLTSSGIIKALQKGKTNKKSKPFNMNQIQLALANNDNSTLSTYATQKTDFDLQENISDEFIGFLKKSKISKEMNSNLHQQN